MSASSSPPPQPDVQTKAQAGVLDGFLVLDLTQIYNGPYATFLLARAGARVIKVEPPLGENLRRRVRGNGVSDPFAALNGSKESIVLNLKNAAGHSVLLDLVRKADVLVENFAPDVMERLGLSYEVLAPLNPTLVYASGSGYGSTGPYRDYLAMDLSMQAMSGVMATTGFADGPPVKAGPALCDFLGGVHLYGAIVTALLRRARSGCGSRVEAAMFDAIYPSLASNTGLHAIGDKGPSRTGNRHGGMSISPYNVYPASDGFVAILAANDRHWFGLVEALGLQHLNSDPRYRTRVSRVKQMTEIDRMVSERTVTMTRAAAFKILADHRVPCAPVRELNEVIEDPHLHATGMLRWLNHPEYGRTLVHDSPIVFADIPRTDPVPSPALGAHADKVMRELLGFDQQRIETLARDGAFAENVPNDRTI